MRRKCIALLLLLALVLPALGAPAARAAEDPVEDFAAALGRFEEEIQVPVRDYDGLMRETFARYPELYFYFDSCAYLSVPEGLEFQVTYQNTQVPRQEVWVVDSDEELMAVLGLASADKAGRAYLVFSGGYAPTEEAVADVYQRVSEEYYLLCMGLYRYQYSGRMNQEWGVRWYQFDLNYWNDVGAETLAQWRDGTEAALLQLSTTLFALDMPDYEKALLIHDYLVDTCRYDTQDLVETDWANHIAYGALVEGSCVCQGYAEAARLLLEAAGVESVCVSGTAGGDNHMWNCVQLGGQWYMMDLTWDDPVTSDGSDVKVYDYFNVTSAQLSQDHQWDAAGYPDCTATDLNYEAVRQLVDGDTTTYTDYSSELVRTQAVQRAELEAILAPAQEALGTETTAGDGDAAQPDDTAEPGDTARPDDTAEPGDAAQPDDTAEPGDTAQPDDTAEPGDTAQPDDTAEPGDQGDGPDLQQVVPLRPERPGRGQPLGPVRLLVTGFIALAVAAALAALVFHWVAGKRVREARERRRIQRERRLSSGAIRRRRR